MKLYTIMIAIASAGCGEDLAIKHDIVFQDYACKAVFESCVEHAEKVRDNNNLNAQTHQSNIDGCATMDEGCKMGDPIEYPVFAETNI